MDIFSFPKKITSVGWSSRCKFFWNAVDPTLVIFLTFFEKNYNDWIKCKLSKSQTKWTGLWSISKISFCVTEYFDLVHVTYGFYWLVFIQLWSFKLYRWLQNAKSRKHQSENDQFGGWINQQWCWKMKKLGVPVVIGGDNLPSPWAPVGIEFTDLPNIKGGGQGRGATVRHHWPIN